jgi:lipoprotein
MKRFIFRLFLPLLLAAVSSCTSVRNVANDMPCENLIIFYDPAAGNAALLEIAKSYGSEVIYIYQNINAIAVTVPAGRTVSAAKEYYGDVKGVLSVSEDRRLQLD